MRLSSNQQQFEREWQMRRDSVEIHTEHARAVRSATYHPWQRFKRTVAIVGFFNVLFGPTFFGVMARYKLEWAIAVEHFFGTTGLVFLPLFNTVVIPTIVGLLEMLLNKCRRVTFMPEPNAHDAVPFLVALPCLEKPSHKVIGDVLSLARSEVKSLLILGTFFQIVQASTHTHDPNKTTILDILFHDPVFTFLGQYFIFGKLLPKLYSLLPENRFRSIKDKVQTFSDRVNNAGFRLFDCAHPGVTDNFVLPVRGLSYVEPHTV